MSSISSIATQNSSNPAYFDSSASSNGVGQSAVDSVAQTVLNKKLNQDKSSWYPQIVSKLDQWETDLDLVPSFWIQQQIDEKTAWVVNKIKSWFSNQQYSKSVNFQSINKWLHTYEHPHLWGKIILYLAKLPLAVMRNVLASFLSTFTAILYTIVHPLKGLLKLTRSLIDLLHALEQAESWTKMGAGFIGIGLGQAIIPGSPVALMGLILGSIFCAVGISMSLFKAFNQDLKGKSKKDFLLNELWKHIHSLPEAFTTGLLLGMIKWSFSTHQVTVVGKTTLQGNTITRLCWCMVTPPTYAPVTQGTLVQSPILEEIKPESDIDASTKIELLAVS